MRKLIVFNQVSLDGYFTGPNGDLGWAHKNSNDAERNEFVASNAEGDSTLLFGRVTYDMMVSYWPTPMAAQNDPVIAKEMNKRPKVVFSKTLEISPWNNTTIVHDAVSHVREMKTKSGSVLVILGSGTIVSQLSTEGLIDEYQVVVNPIVLGGGRTMFEGVDKPLDLKLASTRSFRNGNTLLTYEREA